MKIAKRAVCIILSLVLSALLSLFAAAANAVPAPEEYTAKKNEIFSDSGKITVNAGATEDSLGFSWVTAKNGKPEQFRFGKSETLRDAASAEVTSLYNVSAINDIHRVTLEGLTAGTYYYQYTDGGKWSKIYSVNVDDTSDGFSVMFCSDPQVGRSGDDSDEAVIDDTYGWSRTLSAATENRNLSFAICAGDQVNVALSAKQYNAVLYPETLRSLPLVTAVGNHDFYSTLYAERFFNPNVRENEVLSTGGNGYYFSYGNALFIVINSNNYLMEDHKALVSEAVNSNPDALWRVLVLHETMYFPGSGTENDVVASLFTPIFEEFDIDLVLSGHEHIYSRTGALTGGEADPDGVTYLSASCASGSNYSGADSASEIIAYWKVTTEPTYSIIDFNDGNLSVKSYGTDSGEEFDSFTLAKETPGSGSSYEIPEWYAKVVEVFMRILAILKEKIPFDFDIVK